MNTLKDVEIELGKKGYGVAKTGYVLNGGGQRVQFIVVKGSKEVCDVFVDFTKPVNEIRIDAIYIDDSDVIVQSCSKGSKTLVNPTTEELVTAILKS